MSKKKQGKLPALAVLSTMAFAGLVMSPAQATTIVNSTLKDVTIAPTASNEAISFNGTTSVTGNVQVNAPVTLDGDSTNALQNANVVLNTPSLTTNIPLGSNVTATQTVAVGGTQGGSHVTIKTAAPAADKITVTNNNYPVSDKVVVTGLSSGDTITVYYKDATAVITTQTAQAESNGIATVTIPQLGTDAGTVWVTCTRGSYTESDRVEKAYSAESNLTNSIEVTTAFANNGVIPDKYSMDGGNTSLPVSWKAVENAQSYALIMYDPDANNFVHWMVKDIDKAVTSIGEGKSRTTAIPGFELTNYFGEKGYGGPQPPITHNYKIVVYALNTATINLDDVGFGVSKGAFDAAISGKVIAKGEITGKFIPPLKAPDYLSEMVNLKGTNTITLSFSPAFGAESVWVQQSIDNGVTWRNSTVKEQLTAESWQATVQDLTADTEYNFKVSARKGNQTLESGVFTARTARNLANTDATVTSIDYTVDDTAETIEGVAANTDLATFTGSLTPATGAGLKVYEADGTTEVTTGNLATGMVVIVTAEDGTTKKMYTVTVSAP
ncbi:YbhB/YbcL family Raf kinase inhibitor-like protein [Aneurinibacillus uraniidurans]|uniref:YbhB/YbcL family Raf kinase inhibitor-like protein n=1 Tax=Aneurinibacillus uraniidurans TaxID=2966586 RepID=UPI002349316B|nr:YbhB/YbcL family Raf kinase inhibitor-like protein [Aneurinibacillus sp. B1]WCN38116.1 YbhB/YbcL family Raf kinase inhibitor-like protein [Aneurinibacillus sp. B1]